MVGFRLPVIADAENEALSIMVDVGTGFNCQALYGGKGIVQAGSEVETGHQAGETQLFNLICSCSGKAEGREASSCTPLSFDI